MFADLVKIEDDLLIIFSVIIVLFLVGIIILSLKALFIHQSIEKSMLNGLKSGKYNEVIDRARDLISNNKTKGKTVSLFVLYYIAQAYEAIDSLNNALKYYNEVSLQASKYKKLYSSILLHMAKISDKLGKHKESLANYMILLEKDPDNVEAMFELARIYYKNNSFKKARECLEKVLKKRSRIIEARILYGKILFETGNYIPALRQFNLLEKYDPTNYGVFYYKAKCLENMKKYSEAIKAYQFILGHEWKDEVHNLDNLTLIEIRELSQISVINLYIKIKDYHSGIYYVSEYLSMPSSEKTKTELIYLYANLLWNTGEEYQALKNFERIYMMNAGYKDVEIMYERYKKILPHTYLKTYFTSNEGGGNGKDFDSVCKKILTRHFFKLMYRHLDYYIYEKGVFYAVFYRHIEPIPFSKLTDIEVILNSFQTMPQNIEIYSLYGIRDDAVTHYLLKNSRLIEGDEFIKTIKKTLHTVK